MPKVNTPSRPAGRPKTTGLGVPALVRLHPPLLDNLDAWISAQPEPCPSRPEAIRFALRDWLASQSAAVKSPALPPPSDAMAAQAPPEALVTIQEYARMKGVS